MDGARDQASPKSRRPRAARACEHCRAKKNKCDEDYPCTFCKSRNVECTYRNSDKSRRTIYSTEYVKRLEEQVRLLSSQGAIPPRTSPFTPDTCGGNTLPSPLPHTGPSNSGWSQDQIVPRPIHIAVSSPAHLRSRPSLSEEVSGLNHHTNNVEFYGSSSSMALLHRVQTNRHGTTAPQDVDEEGESLISTLHNPVFSPVALTGSATRPVLPSVNTMVYYQKCRAFIDAFFGSLHYIHPILDRAVFLARCENLWFGEPSAESKSFKALHYSILSLGALVGSTDEESLGGISRLEWSRRFFGETRVIARELAMVTDLEMVQCFFFMAKVCQNELNPHWSYMYVGLAVRTALAIGINREPLEERRRDSALMKAESRTWWGLYSLETEMSFAMGRPDTLGADLYHNRRFPQIQSTAPNFDQDDTMSEPPYCAIIECMVAFSRITKTVCLDIFLAPNQYSITKADQIERDLDCWLDGLPPGIRPLRIFASSRSLKAVKDAQYMKKQRLVLAIRYHNVRMLLYGSFLGMSGPAEQPSAAPVAQGIQKCLDSAKQSIDIIYETFRHSDFFRTWFYNTTYTLFAVSIVLVYIMQEASPAEKEALFQYVEMAIEILETMDECVVAVKAAHMIRRALARAKEPPAQTEDDEQQRPMEGLGYDVPRTLNHYWGPLNLMDGEIDVGFPFVMGDLEQGYSVFNDFGQPMNQ